ncbi:MAG: fibronectin type III domain-containing protein, partial [Verrucomicrobiota bacterium]|nr:fibronectin type III domain-containing protein [Verrucomicrobiota bacterium]
MEPTIEGGTAILIRPRACAAIVSPRAYLHWIERAVPCDGSATLELRDLDLAGVGSITLAMEYWAGGDPGRRPYGEIELTEVAPPSGVFTGAFSILDRPDMLPGDGDLIFALYEDTSTAGGPRALEAMLPVDCEPPSLIGTGLSLLEPERAVLTVRADENCYGTLLLYKDACPSAPGAEPWRGVEAVFVTSYSGQVTVGELLPGTRYFYQWLLRDLAGNEAIFDNDGICYEFSTEARTTAAFPFLEDFEREELAPYWRPQSYDEGRISITSRFEPYHGRKHLLMDDYLINSARSLNELTLTIDLEGQEDVSLRFYHKSLGDEPNGMPEQFDNHYNADGVAMSLDGRRWYRLVSLTPTEGVQSQYREFRVPLDPVLDRAFGSFHDRVQIRFQQYDNSPADQDGFAFDYIQVVPTDRTPPEFGGLHSVQPGQNSVRLSWFAATDPSLPIRYRVYMSSEPGQQNFQEPISETVGTIHEVKGLNAAQEYHFVVRAVDGDGNEDSNRVEFTASPLDSQPPVFLGLRSILGEAEGVRLGWIEALDGSMPILYEVYMGPSGAPVETYDMALQTTNVFGVVTGLPLDRPTCFMVRARDAAGNLDANTEVLCGAPVALLPQQPPIREGFESGELSDSWRILGTGRAAVTSGYGSAEGDQALLLDAPVAGTELLGSAAVLLADLAGATNVVLSFSYRNLGDEPHLLPDRFEEFALGDGVAISPDGIHWARVYSLAGGSDGLWRSVSFSLDRILSELEWTYTDRFRIGFFQADNAPAPQDGILFDAIVVREKDIVPPLFEGLQLASPLDSAARLSWEPAVETESLPVWYEIYRAYEQEELVYQTPIAFSDQTSVVVSNLSGTVSYRFAVRARDASGNVDTNEVERVVQPFDTIRPQFQGLQEVRSSDRALRLYWQAARDPSRPIYYDVYSVVDGTVGAKVYSTQASSAVISGLRNGKTYCFMVRARDGAGNLDLNDKVLCGIPTVESEDVVFVDAAADPSLADGTILHPFPRIADGLVAAALGAEIRIAEGRYPESLVLSTPVRISGGWRSDYSVWDPDFFTVILTGGPEALPLVDIHATGVHCEGIRFSPADGQAIRVSGSVILERCRIAGIGGEPAIDVDGGQVTMLSVQMQGNGTQAGPIVQVDRGHLEMESVLLTGFSLRGGQPALLELANGATGGLRYVTAAGNLLGGGVVLRVGSGCYCTGLGLIFKGNLGASLDVLPDAVVEIDHAFLDPYRGTPVFGDGVDLETAPGYRAPGLGDYHLTADAPAVDVIPLAELAGDLPRAGADGLPRPFGGAMDAGAFEYRDVDGNGIPDDRDLDADGDGLPNHWERRLGLDWLRADAGEDYDGDGFDNASEFRAGTDPFDPASALRILEL